MRRVVSGKDWNGEKSDEDCEYRGYAENGKRHGHHPSNQFWL
jgi:hypothetical protein